MAYTLKNIDRVIRRSGAGKKVPARHLFYYRRDINTPPKHKTHATLVVLNERRPIMQTAKVFTPGFIHGRIFLWSVPEARFICATELTVNTSEFMKIRKQGTRQQSLERSLEWDVFYKAQLMTLP